MLRYESIKIVDTHKIFRDPCVPSVSFRHDVPVRTYVCTYVRSAIFKPISSVGSKIGPRLRDRRLEGGRILLDIYYVNSKAILYNKNVALKVKLRDPRRPSRSGVAIREKKRVSLCLKNEYKTTKPNPGSKNVMSPRKLNSNIDTP